MPASILSRRGWRAHRCARRGHTEFNYRFSHYFFLRQPQTAGAEKKMTNDDDDGARTPELTELADKC